MNIKEAYKEMINQKSAVKTLGELGYKPDVVWNMRLRIKKDMWPTIEKMKNLLHKHGYQVIQEEKWVCLKAQ